MPHVCALIKGLGLPDLGGNLGCGSTRGAVLAGNLHLKDGVGLLVVRGFGIGQERHDASLEGAKSAFDFPFGLRTGGDEVGDPKTFECALELTFGIAFVITGTHSKEAQGICVDHFGDAVLLKGPPEVQEVIPSGVAGDEGASEIGARGIVEGQEQGLLGGGWPPLVDRAVVLPEFPNVGATKSAVDARLAHGPGDEVREVRFDVSLNGGARSLESTKTFEFIGDELKVRRLLQREKAFQKCDRRCRPRSASISAAWSPSAVGFVAKEGRAKLIKPCSADLQMRRCGGRIQRSRIEIAQCAADKLGRQTVRKLRFFISALYGVPSIGSKPASHACRGPAPGNPRSFAHGTNGLLPEAGNFTSQQMLRSEVRPEPLWYRLPLRVPSGRAVSCKRCPNFTADHLREQSKSPLIS